MHELSKLLKAFNVVNSVDKDDYVWRLCMIDGLVVRFRITVYYFEYKLTRMAFDVRLD